jgi:hypothetical protein
LSPASTQNTHPHPPTTLTYTLPSLFWFCLRAPGKAAGTQPTGVQNLPLAMALRHLPPIANPLFLPSGSPLLQAALHAEPELAFQMSQESHCMEVVANQEHSEVVLPPGGQCCFLQQCVSVNFTGELLA